MCRRARLSKTSKWILILSCVTIFLLFGVPRIFLLDVSMVSGSSMDDILKNGDIVVARKVAIDHLSRGKIVTVQRRGSSSNIVKRIIGLPTETIDIDEHGLIYIDGELISDEYQVYMDDKVTYPYTHLVLGEDEYFIIGDNRQNSHDSRYFGAIHLDEIRNVIFLRVFPFLIC